MWRLPEQGKDFRDCHHVLELFGGRLSVVLVMDGTAMAHANPNLN
jgi:hypothetical protein